MTPLVFNQIARARSRVQRSLSYAIWAVHARVVRRLSPRGSPSTRSTFATTGYASGVLPREQTLALVEGLAPADSVDLVQDDCAAGYEFSPTVRGRADQMRVGTTFLRLGTEGRERLGPLLKNLETPVSESLGAPWRVLNVRCWRTAAEAREVGANEWHVDGFPRGICKIMVYLSPVGPEIGTTALALPGGACYVVSGPIGTWLLFKNGEILHRGLPPTNDAAERVAVEITIAPSLRTDVTVVSAGVNAKYPRFPWTRRPAAA